MANATDSLVKRRTKCTRRTSSTSSSATAVDVVAIVAAAAAATDAGCCCGEYVRVFCVHLVFFNIISGLLLLLFPFSNLKISSFPNRERFSPSWANINSINFNTNSRDARSEITINLISTLFSVHTSYKTNGDQFVWFIRKSFIFGRSHSASVEPFKVPVIGEQRRTRIWKYICDAIRAHSSDALNESETMSYGEERINASLELKSSIHIKFSVKRTVNQIKVTFSISTFFFLRGHITSHAY